MAPKAQPQSQSQQLQQSQSSQLPQYNRFLTFQYSQDILTSQSLVDAYFNHKKQVQELFPLLQKSSIKIQQCWRKFKQYKKYNDIRRKVIKIQSFYRGYRARKNIASIIEAQAEEDSFYYFHYCAIQIQRIWRGYLVRRVEGQNYYQRKQELEMIRENELKLQAYIQEELHKKELDKLRQDEEKQYNQFQKMAASLHHLVSTKSINGVYNPPQLPLQTDTIQVTATIPSVGDNIPLETALRAVGRDVARRTVRIKSKQVGTNGKSTMNAQVILDKTINSKASNRLISLDFTDTANSKILDPSEKVSKFELHKAANELLPIDPRDAKRTDQDKRIGPFLPQHKLLKKKLTNYEPSVLRSSTFDYKKEQEKFEQKLNQLSRIGDTDFDLRKKPSEKLILRDGPSLRSIDGIQTRKSQEKVKISTPWKPKIRTDSTFDRGLYPTLGL